MNANKILSLLQIILMKHISLIITLAAFAALSYGQIPVSHAPIDKEPLLKINEDLVGIWKMREDTNYHDYFVVEKRHGYAYSVTYMNRGGDNRTYEHFNAYLSEVGKMQFLNVQYPGDVYVLLKILSIGRNGFEMTAVAVSNVSLDKVSKPEEVRKIIEANINNPSFYKDTLHFRKKLPLHVW